jgi:hypothetical protein
MAPDTTPGLNVHTTPCGVTGTMTLLELQHLVAGPKIRDLSRIGVDWTTVGRDVLAGGAAVPTESIGTFLDEHFVRSEGKGATPKLDGTQQTNAWLVRGQGGGSAGDTVFGYDGDPAAAALDGLLESVATVSTIQDGDSALAAAQTRLALTSDVLTLESAILSPDAPFTIDQLVPGALCELALDSTCIPVTGPYRLQKVTVTASAPDGEVVTLAFQPVGTDPDQ